MMEVLQQASWQAIFVVTAALLIDCGWKSMPPQWRSWLWRLVFLKLAIAMLPVSFGIPVLPAEGSIQETTQEVVVTQFVVDNGVSVTAQASRSVSWGTVLIGTWAIGIIYAAFSMLVDVCKARRIAKRWSTVKDVRVHDLLATIASRLQLSRLPELRQSSNVSSPCLMSTRLISIRLFGIGARPTLVLPSSWLRSGAIGPLKLALAHELAHDARCDLPWNRFVYVIRSLLFFHPLVWLATQRYALAQEIACDEIALRQTKSAASEYAGILLRLVEQPAAPLSVAALTGQSSTLKARIKAMYQTSNLPSRLVSRTLAVAGIVLLIPFSLSAQSPGSQEQSSSQKSTQSPASASSRASASAFGSAGGFARGMQGARGVQSGRAANQFGNAFNRAQAMGAVQAQASASIGGKQQPKQTSSPGQRTSSASRSPIKQQRSFSKVRQTMSSNSSEKGDSWKRSTEALLDGQQVRIEETKDLIKVTLVNPDGGEKVYAATDVQGLEKTSEKAASLYRKLCGSGKMNAKAVLNQGKIPLFDEQAAMNNMDINIVPSGNAEQMLRRHLQSLQNEPDLQNNPAFQMMVEEMERLFEQE
ncbi:Regulatory protein BlaR1 [Stieleria bergensis]|uniref:Regulatory protein BlaR1 n=1 Tax=Stieleria bergensis TaxID=2528025 RepID=A0A517SV25_9BACT|nr:Regulatory protein BlaR1 [Planctomycetes bacterium SV_7m_r]